MAKSDSSDLDAYGEEEDDNYEDYFDSEDSDEEEDFDNLPEAEKREIIKLLKEKAIKEGADPEQVEKDLMDLTEGRAVDS